MHLSCGKRIPSGANVCALGGRSVARVVAPRGGPPAAAPRRHPRTNLRCADSVSEAQVFAWGSQSYLSYDDDFRALLQPQEVSLQHEVARLEALLARANACGTLEAKVAMLDQHVDMVNLRCSSSESRLWRALDALPLDCQYVVKLLPAIGQSHLLMLEPPGGCWEAPLQRLADALLRVDAFYNSMGGVIGYQLKSLRLILAANGEGTPAPAPLETAAETAANNGAAAASGASRAPVSSSSDAGDNGGGSADGVTYHVPPGLDLAGEGGRRIGVHAAAQGLLALPYTAEVYPVGGAGDRLGLKCDVTGQSLPSAMLPYCGRTMIEGLLRDLTAREYLYWHLTGRQVTTPVAIMTSDAKGNHERIVAEMERLQWLGRGRSSFKLFRQPMVPMISAEDGRWLLTGPLQCVMKPGGHGAIWKLMHDEGVFAWLEGQRRAAALVRQISNPMAGVDTTLLALAGTGFTQRRAFGFMSCERVVGAAEGMNVLQERKVWVPDASHPDGGRFEFEYAITNVEYTEFERLGISDVAQEGSNHSVFPANTNILYVGLQAAKDAVQRAISAGGDEVLPGLIFNLKKKVTYFDPLSGEHRSIKAGRMECTMQNLADSLASRSPFSLTSAPAAPEPLPSSAVRPGKATHGGPMHLLPSPPPAAARAGRGGGLGGDAVVDPALAQQLSTFMVYNLRRKVTSSAKKRREAGSARIHQTPDGSFYDLMRNGWQVLQRCGMRYVPEVGDVQTYLESGPGFIFLFHPALGPLWDVISQKIRGGALCDRSELVLEVAEARLVDVTIDGSLLVSADNVMGTCDPPPPSPASPAAAAAPSDPQLRFSAAAGRVHLMNVTVQNVGVDWRHPGNLYWRHQVHRHEACRVVLHGRSEFEAYDVKLSGNQVFEVPDGFRMVVTSGPGGRLQRQLLPLAAHPSWEWRYAMDGSGAVELEFVRHSTPADPWRARVTHMGLVEESPLDFII